jgi:hypothetical protein
MAPRNGKYQLQPAFFPPIIKYDFNLIPTIPDMLCPDDYSAPLAKQAQAFTCPVSHDITPQLMINRMQPNFNNE